MQIEFFRNEVGEFSHLHIVADTPDEQAMLNIVEGDLVLCREESSPNTLGIRRKIYIHARGEAHGLIYNGWMK